MTALPLPLRKWQSIRVVPHPPFTAMPSDEEYKLLADSPHTGDDASFPSEGLTLGDLANRRRHTLLRWTVVGETLAILALLAILLQTYRASKAQICSQLLYCESTLQSKRCTYVTSIVQPQYRMRLFMKQDGSRLAIDPPSFTVATHPTRSIVLGMICITVGGKICCFMHSISHAVAITDFGISQISKAEAMRLPNKTVPLPASPSHYVMTISAFHQLHCLVRRSYRRQIRRDTDSFPVNRTFFAKLFTRITTLIL